mgnify:FL=1
MNQPSYIQLRYERWLYHHKESRKIADFYRKAFVLVEQTVPDELLGAVSYEGAYVLMQETHVQPLELWRLIKSAAPRGASGQNPEERKVEA